MTFIIDTDNLENNNFQLTENESGDLVLTHKSTGATFDYDSTNEQWVASGGIKTSALEAEQATIKDEVVRTDGDDINRANRTTFSAFSRDAEEFVGLTTNVGSDPKIIANTAGVSFVIVVGNDVDSGGGERFCDTVQGRGFADVEVLSESSSGDGRTYSINENDIELAMSDGEYDVIAKTLRLQ